MMDVVRRRLVAILAAHALCALLIACTSRGGLTFAPAAANGDVEAVIVSTTRRQVEDQPFFTSDRALSPTFAEFHVSVPPDRDVGSVTYPSGYPPDPRTDFFVVSGKRLAGEPAFVAAINRRLRANRLGEETTSLFTHGYNTNFAEGLYRHAQLQHDYDSHAATVHFSWPSAASGQGYVYDNDSALYSRGALETTFDAMARSDASKINVISHSMGAFLTMDTLAGMARVGHDTFFQKLNAILLISPDIDIDVFRAQARPVLERGAPIFVVVSSRDRALLVSAVIRGGHTRVGSAATAGTLGDLDVTVIDVTGVESGGGLGHFTVANSPELIGLLQGFREAGVDVLSTERQSGVIGTSISLIQQGADFVVSPLAGP
jgi:esterase/lipase superfamily enzyme